MVLLFHKERYTCNMVSRAGHQRRLLTRTIEAFNARFDRQTSRTLARTVNVTREFFSDDSLGIKGQTCPIAFELLATFSRWGKVLLCDLGAVRMQELKSHLPFSKLVQIAAVYAPFSHPCRQGLPPSPLVAVQGGCPHTGDPTLLESG